MAVVISQTKFNCHELLFYGMFLYHNEIIKITFDTLLCMNIGVHKSIKR
jgi:hypothetical protein